MDASHTRGNRGVIGKRTIKLNMMKKLFMTLGVAAMALAACTQSKDAGKPAIDLANFDNTVSAGEDFYQYACGGWMAANPLTPEYARYGIFDQLDKENQERLKALIEEVNAVPQEAGTCSGLSY